MYSKALKILDKNTVEYMIDELREQLDQQKKEHKAELAKHKAELTRQRAESDAEIQLLREQLEKYKDKSAE